MRAKTVFAIYAKELMDSLRDRRTVMSIIIIPTIVIPLLMGSVLKIAAKTMDRAKSQTAAIAILGGEDSPKVVSGLRGSPKFKVVEAGEHWKERISDKSLQAVVQIPAGFERDLSQGKVDEVVIYDYSGEIRSGFAASELTSYFSDLKEATVRVRLEERKLPEDLINPFTTRTENAAPPEKVGGNAIGSIIPYIIVILCFTGAMYPAMDLTAGEKERGTMETLLSSPAARSEIVAGKFLMVLTGSVAAMVLALCSMALMAYTGGMLMGGPAGAHQAAKAASAMPAMSIDPLGIVGTLAMVAPVSVLFSAVLFTVALTAKTFKEAQSYVSPMVFLVILPAVVGMLPGVELNAKFALIPILNLSLVCKEMLSGVWHWHYIALIFGSSCVYAGIALFAAVRMFNREDVLFRT